MEQRTSTPMQLQDELAHIDRLIEAAAVDEDVVEFSRLVMRKAALPALIREARAQPLRAEISRLEDELDSLEDELREAQEGPLPEVSPKLRGQVTPEMARRQVITGISSRSSRVSRELKDAKARLVKLEG